MKARILVIIVSAGAFLTSSPLWSAEPKGPDTTIKEVIFRLKLPGVWKSGKTNDSNKRTYYTNTEQLTVSIFGGLFGEPGSMSHEGQGCAFQNVGQQAT